MALSRISIRNFRNHQDTQLDTPSAFNLLVGENGAGKTNILEALSLFAPGRGLRRAKLSEMASAAGPGGFEIGATLTDNGTLSPASEDAEGGDRDGAPVRLATWTLPDRPNRRFVRVNGAETSASTLSEWQAITWLTPAMDGLFTDSASARRRYMDRLALALNPSHARTANRYEAALRERNRLLSAPAMPEAAWFDGVEAQMADLGSALAAQRSALVETLAGLLKQVGNDVFARPLLRYVPGGPAPRDALAEALQKNRQADRQAGRTLIGPHRDELHVTMARTLIPAAQCSTGEQKAMLLAITLAHAELAARGRPSLVLLDEVAAHLDPLRRGALFARLRGGGGQIWLTGTEQEPFADVLAEAALWQVKGGQVTRLS